MYKMEVELEEGRLVNEAYTTQTCIIPVVQRYTIVYNERKEPSPYTQNDLLHKQKKENNLK